MHRTNRWIRRLGLAAVAVLALQARADDDEDGATHRLTLHGYGVAHYQHFDWDTDPDRRAALDLERVTLYPSWRLGESSAVRAEIEFEHGGTGAALEFDRFEEFGEFEYEIEKGGEVLLEQFYLDWQAHPRLAVHAGRFKLPIGLAATHDEPGEFFTVGRSEVESAIIPVNWYETGVQLALETPAAGKLRAVLSLVNGLDSSGFSSSSWVARGYQLRFETVNAEALATTLHLSWAPCETWNLGGTAYYGDSAGNRPKDDLDVSAHVFVGELHGTLERPDWIARALWMRGTLENSDLVSRQNRRLSNNLNVKRTPVGHAADGWMVEGGRELSRFLPLASTRLWLFGRYEKFDSMAEVEGEVFDNPRWERDVITGGLNWLPRPEVVVKATHSVRELGLPDHNQEVTTALGLGVEF